MCTQVLEVWRPCEGCFVWVENDKSFEVGAALTVVLCLGVTGFHIYPCKERRLQDWQGRMEELPLRKGC